MSEEAYIGSELEIFAHARNWKSYWASELEPLLSGAVLEVGAGFGSNTALMRSARQDRWVCLEPDRKLLDQLGETLALVKPELPCERLAGTIDDIPSDERFNAILYIDVLEHVDDDRGELRRAAELLKPGGWLIVLSPAHQWLFTDFDRAIGHRRRYTARTLRELTPAGSRIEKIIYLDSAGLLASLANRLFLRQSMPTVEQIKTWDRLLIPVSRVTDKLMMNKIGKSVLGIWKSVG